MKRGLQNDDAPRGQSDAVTITFGFRGNNEQRADKLVADFNFVLEVAVRIQTKVRR